MVTAAVEWSIRPARPDEAAVLASLHCRTALHAYREIFPRTAPKPTPATLLPLWRTLVESPDSAVFVAVREETITGTVALAPDDGVPSGLLLVRLYVEVDAWGVGIGAALHDHALREAAARGHRSINLWVLERNDHARAMYERRGWRIVPGRTVALDPPTVRDVLYARTL